MNPKPTTTTTTTTGTKISAPKTKSGCKTCRRRRVKCDEGKPICTPCLKSRRTCIGYLYQGLREDYPTASHLRAEESVVLRQRPLEIDPEIGELIDAHITHHTLLNHHYKDKVFFMEAHPPVMGAPNGFIPVRNSLMRSSLILSRIAITSNQYKIEFEPSHTYGTAHLWTELLGRRQHILEHINEMLSNYDVESLPSAVIRRLCDFMNIEHKWYLPSWKLHLKGLLTMFIDHGLAKRYIESEPRMLDVLQLVVIYTIIGNSTAPANQQITSIYRLKDEHIRLAYALDYFPPFPCPSDLIMEIHAISRLRLVVSALSSSSLRYISDQKRMQDAIDGILKRVIRFDPKHWKETFPMPDVPDVGLIASLFKAVIPLYAIQTLPAPASIIIDESVCQKELLRLVRVMIPRPRCHLALPWPLAVLGASLTNGSEKDQQTVLDGLLVVQGTPLACHAMINAKKKLRRFWSSGQTGWDDCWREMFLLI